MSKPRSPKVVVNITADAIERGVQANSRTCMIAEAVKLSVPGASAVTVDLATIRFTDRTRGLRYTYLTPREAQRHLIAFDEGSDMQPFTILLRNALVTLSRSGRLRSSPDDPLRKKAVRERSDGVQATAVGGRTPPQMNSTRRFGIRAFIRGEGGKAA